MTRTNTPWQLHYVFHTCCSQHPGRAIPSIPCSVDDVYLFLFCQFVKLHTLKWSDWLAFCRVLTGVQCSAVLPTKKEKLPTHTTGWLSPHIALKSDSKHKTQRLEKRQGSDFPYFFNHLFSLWSVQGHFSSQSHFCLSQCKTIWICTNGMVLVLI